VNLDLHVGSRFLYSEIRSAHTLDRIHRHSIHRRCLLERSNLESKLALARLMPDLIARQLLNTPGAQGIVSGEVFFVQTCPAVWVQPRETSLL